MPEAYFSKLNEPAARAMAHDIADMVVIQYDKVLAAVERDAEDWIAPDGIDGDVEGSRSARQLDAGL